MSGSSSDRLGAGILGGLEGSGRSPEAFRLCVCRDCGFSSSSRSMSAIKLLSPASLFRDSDPDAVISSSSLSFLFSSLSFSEINCYDSVSTSKMTIGTVAMF